MRRLPLIALALVTVLLTGCGGNGSSVDSGPLSPTNSTGSAAYKGPNKGSVNFFVTNSSGEGYAHAWVVLKKVELKLAAGGTKTLYEDPVGIGLDLASLRGAKSPVFQLLSGMTLPVGTYTGIHVTVAPEAVFFPVKTDKVMGADFPGKGDAVDSLLTLDFDAPKVLGSAPENLVLDFNLGDWSSQDKKLAPKLKFSNGNTIESPSLMIPTLVQGQVAELKGKTPEMSFVLRPEKGVDLAVHMTAATGVRNLGPNSRLKNGAWIEMGGSFDMNAHRFEASSVTIAEQKDQLSTAVLQGSIASLEDHGAKLLINPAATRGFAPTADKIGVSTKSAATLDSNGRPVERISFYQSLSQSKEPQVQVRGTFDRKQQTFSATEIRLVAAPEAPRESGPKTQKV